MNIVRVALYIGLILLIFLTFIIPMFYPYLITYFTIFIIEEILLEFITLKLFQKIKNYWGRILLLHEELKKLYKALLICLPIFLLIFIFLKNLLWFSVTISTLSFVSLLYEIIKEIEDSILKT